MVARTFVIPVVAESGTPASGQVLRVGPLTGVNSVNTTGISDSQLNYGLHGAFGGGAFSSTYGTHGAFLTGGQGAHGGPEIIDVFAFDFSTDTWTRLANTNGADNRFTAVPIGETTGSPYYERTTPPGITANAVPAAAHSYQYMIANGAHMLLTLRPVSTSSGPDGATRYAHQFNTTTRAWSRFSSNACPAFSFSAPSVEGAALHDTALNRAYVLPQSAVYVNQLAWLDLATGAYGSQAVANAPGAGPPYQHYVLHTSGATKCILAFSKSATTGHVLDLTAGSWAWQAVALTNAPSFDGVRWSRYPTDGCYYTYNSGNAAVTKLTPPASITGTWVFSSVTPSSGSFPARSGFTGFDNRHYTCFMYVPARGCFAWIAGGSSQVALWKP